MSIFIFWQHVFQQILKSIYRLGKCGFIPHCFYCDLLTLIYSFIQALIYSFYDILVDISDHFFRDMKSFVFDVF